MSSLFLMLAFGVLGVLARYEIQVHVSAHWPEYSHLATFFVNVSGSFLVGLVYVLSLEKAHLSDEMRMALTIGFLGGFTTFSAYALESIRLLETAQMARTFFYVALSPALAIVFCFFGMVVGRKFG